jgi:HK97 family phage portal protein
VIDLGFISWLASKFAPASVPLSGDDLAAFTDEYMELYGDIYIRELAFWSAVNLVANSVSKCEFKTYRKGEEVKEREYYLWNIEPNRNQNSSGFIHKWISQMYRHNECLIVEQNGQLLVADSYTRKPYALYDDVFEQVKVGDFTFDRPFWQSEVLYFKLSECNMRRVTEGLYAAYGKLAAYAMKAFQKSRGTKGVFSYDTLPPAGTDDRKAFDALVNEKFKTFLEADNSVIPLGKGQRLEDFANNKTYSSDSSRDIRALVDDISDFTAKAFGIPPALLRGNVEGVKDALDLYLTFCIDPLVDMLQEEINRKRNGYAGFTAGTYLQIDTKAIKHVDLLSVATAIDKLIGSGAFCINDIRKVCGENIIDEPWAWEHFITKNYTTFAEAMAALEGGDGNG